MEAPRQHDAEALLAHAGWVRALAHSLVSDANAADDVAQDALTAALEHPPRSERSVRGFLASIVRNFARERSRREARREFREQVAARGDALPSTLDTVERFALHKQVVHAVESLEDPYRTAILLRYFDGLPPRAIAKRLGLPVKTIHTRLSRALDQLRARLDRAHDGDRRAWIVAFLPLATNGSSVALHPIKHLAPSLGAASMSTQAKVVIIAVVIALSAAWRFARPSRVQDQRVGGEIERGVLRANDGSGAIELAQAPSAREPLNAEPATAAVSAAVRSEDESLELRGRVVDGSDAPVEGAEIVAMFAPGRTFDYLGDMDYWNEQHRVANARSDSAGEFAFKLDKFGPFDLHVRA